jgi:hypothetical protein
MAEAIPARPQEAYKRSITIVLAAYPPPERRS